MNNSATYCLSYPNRYSRWAALAGLCLSLNSISSNSGAQSLGDDVLEQVLGNIQGSFAQADPAYRLQFPRDHGVHPDFRHEWWYLNGNLQDAQGRHFAYQFTLFRYALAAPTASDSSAESASAWHSQQLYMAHFAISDSHTQHFYHAERFSRGALNLAGVESTPWRAWLYDWQLSAAASDSEPPWHLQAQARDGADEGAAEFALDIQLELAQGRVLQGEEGYSRKGHDAASHYYSYPRLHSHGQLRIGTEQFSVDGDSWFDREWGSATLNPQQQGWDWFALQLKDGRQLMWYQLRLKQGGIDPASQGILVLPDQQQQPLSPAQVQFQPLTRWTSPDGRCYPIHWRAQIDGLPELEIRPRLPQQWWDGLFRYWEGAVSVHAGPGDDSIIGQGYLELSGYPPQNPCP